MGVGIMTNEKTLDSFAKWFMESNNKEIIIIVFVGFFTYPLIFLGIWLSNLTIILIALLLKFLIFIVLILLYLMKKNKVIELQEELEKDE